MKKLFCKILLLFMTCGVSIGILNYLFTNYNGHYTYKMINEMYNSTENIDILFLGSSHVYRSYDTEIADEFLEKKTFNAGSSSQLLDQSYYLLKEVAKTNKLDTVYLDTYFSVANAESSKRWWAVYIISDYTKNSFDKIEYLYESGGLETLFEGFISVRRNINNINICDNINSRKVLLNDYSTVSYDNEEYRGNGFVYSFEVLDKESINFSRKIDLTANTFVSDFSYEYLIRIIEFCKENDIKLVLVDQPMPKELLDNVKGYNDYVKFMWEFADQNKISYLNFNCYKGNVPLTLDNYKDIDHLNGSGAEIYTKLFVDTVKRIEQEDLPIDTLFNRSYNEV